MCLRLRLGLFWQKEISIKAACKMLVKLTAAAAAAADEECVSTG